MLMAQGSSKSERRLLRSGPMASGPGGGGQRVQKATAVETLGAQCSSLNTGDYSHTHTHTHSNQILI